jgi:hypothetical protein
LEALRCQVADATAEGVRLNGALVQARQEAATAVLRAEGAEAQAQCTAEALAPVARAAVEGGAGADALALEPTPVTKKPATRRRG